MKREYTWEGLKVISYEEAVEMYKQGYEIHQTYDGDSEAIIGESNGLKEMADSYKLERSFGYYEDADVGAARG